MSEYLFPRASNRKSLKLKLSALTAAAMALVVLVCGYIGLRFTGGISSDVRLVAQVQSLGDSLGVASDVKFRGLRVGRVVSLNQGNGGPKSAEILIFSEFVNLIPQVVKARVLPSTLFGNEFIELAIPAGLPGAKPGAAVSGPFLQANQTIAADTSKANLRLMDTFTAAQRIIGAIDPAVLDQALSQFSAALQGNGKNLKKFIKRADLFFADWAKHEPDFYVDLDAFVKGAEVMADIEPGLIKSIKNSLPLAATVIKQRLEFAKFVASSVQYFDHVAKFMREQHPNFSVFVNSLGTVLHTFVGGIRPFQRILDLLPGLLNNGANAIKNEAIQMEAHLDGDFLTGPYTKKDCVRYGALAGTNC